ncbi:hypothetical protein BGZ54_001918 [Gamsiella multidivaricata]|nr:hypothetical protein BGZ54_001918 [Gamsiella multidivaricata]
MVMWRGAEAGTDTLAEEADPGMGALEEALALVVVVDVHDAGMEVDFEADIHNQAIEREAAVVGGRVYVVENIEELEGRTQDGVVVGAAKVLLDTAVLDV